MASSRSLKANGPATGFDSLRDLVARLQEGETDPRILVATGDAAANAGYSQVALECLRRLDPLSAQAAKLRTGLLDRGLRQRVPERPSALPDDPAEVVASACRGLLTESGLLPLVLRRPLPPAIFLGLATLTLLFPPVVAAVLALSVFTGFLVWLVPLGVRLRDLAWCLPDGGPPVLNHDPHDTDPQASAISATAVSAVAIPLALGFLAGIGWSAILAPGTCMLAMLLLVSRPLHRLGTGYPFAATPRPREWGAITLSALLAYAGALVTAFLAWGGWFGLIPAMVAALASWVFMNRAAGLLGRRILFRLEAARAAAALFPDIEDDPALMVSATPSAAFALPLASSVVTPALGPAQE